MNVFEASFTFGIEKSRLIADCLMPESAGAGEGGHERSKTTVSAEGEFLILRISAPDLHALRAAVNTYVKWIAMCGQLSE
ncbi:MAG: KEOPS complex subunit Pcc1 [Candidatus Altiarchaeota archaeon]|nr:KEOPS complex subunit Pcc1 [Candidatus Altiarchaeota archaeon]